MNFSPLSPNAEKLLQEILDNRLENGICDEDYWKKRFEQLVFAEASLLQSTFSELEKAAMISMRWADNYPYYLVVLNGGASYFEIKKRVEKKEKDDKKSSRLHDLLMVLIGAAFTGLLDLIIRLVS